MPYDTNDLRSQLSATRTIERPAGAAFAPQYFEFGDLEPDEVSAAGTKTWIACVTSSRKSPSGARCSWSSTT